MDKLEILLNMTEHPENYTEQQMEELLADENVRKHYDTMVKLREAYAVAETTEGKRRKRHLKLSTFHRVAAVLIVLFSISTLTMAITLKKKMAEQRALHAIYPVEIYEIPTISADEYKLLLKQIDEDPTNAELSQKYDSINALSPLYYELYGTTCSWYCGGKVLSKRASSELKPIGKLNYKISNADDFDHTTAWVEGTEGTGKGEFLEYTFAGNCPRITTVKILNGYCKNQKTWEQNGRVKTLKMYYNNLPVLKLELEDSPTLQCFNVGTFGEHNPNAPDWKLRFEILEVYPGSKFEDIAISELYFDGIDVH